MNLFFWRRSQEKTDKKVADPIAYIAEPEKYSLQNPIIVVGFPGKYHIKRIESDEEAKIRDYLDKRLVKRRIKTKTEDTNPLTSDRRNLRGRGKLDRSYHDGRQYHFYEAHSHEEMGEATKALKDYFGLNLISKLPGDLVSDFEKFV